MATKKPKERAAHPEITALIATSGRTQSEVAAYLTRRLGRDIRHYQVSRMQSGERGVSSDEMDALRELAAAPTTEPAVAPQLMDTGDAVPLFGYASALGSVLRINEDERVGVVPAHPAQHGSRSAYAFICFGDSVSPRLNHGEVGYAIRNRTPFKGQLCVIRKANGDALVKFFESMDDRTLFASQLNPLQKLTFPLRELAGVDAVVGASFGPG